MPTIHRLEGRKGQVKLRRRRSRSDRQMKDGKMNEGWRELSANEAKIIRKMTSKVASQFIYEPQKYIGKVIDEFGSIALRNHGTFSTPNHILGRRFSP